MGCIRGRRRAAVTLIIAACCAGGSVLVTAFPSRSELGAGAVRRYQVASLAVRPPGNGQPLAGAGQVSVKVGAGPVDARRSPAARLGGLTGLADLQSPPLGMSWPTGGPVDETVTNTGSSPSPDTEIDPHTMATLVATAPINGPVQQVTFPISLASASLSPVGPASSATPIRPDQAYLMVNMTAAVGDAGGTQVEPYVPIPAGDLSLRLPDGTAVLHPVSATGGSLPTLLSPTYTFVVPSRLVDAQLVIAPTQVAGQYFDTSDTYKPVTLTFTAPATFALTFPPPSQAAPPASQRARRPSTPHAKVSGFPLGEVVLLLVVAAVLIGVGVEIARRRRRWLPAKPVQTSYEALLALTDDERVRLDAPRSPPALQAPPASLPPASLGPEDSAAAEAPPAPPCADRDAAARPALVIRILGTLDVQGLIRTVRTRSMIRLLVCLAIHPEREVSVEELRDAMATKTDDPPAAATVHSRASTLRNHHLPADVLPRMGPGSTGYRLGPGVEVDWAVFQALTARAHAVEGADRWELLCRALRLVRGAPLAHSLWQGVIRACQQMETTIETTAADAARLALEQRDSRGAEWAVSQGMRALPESLVLWEHRLVAAAAGSGYGLERAWRAAQKRLGADASILAATHQRLASGAF